MTSHSDPNKVTFQHIDQFLFGGAFTGMAGIGKNLAAAAGERIVAHGMNHATGALVGYGTEWQRALLITSKHRPSKPGQVVGGTGREHPANVIEYGQAVTVELRTPAGRDDVSWYADGVVFGWDDDGIELEDGPYIEWDEVVRLEAGGVTVWQCYSGDEVRDHVVNR